MSCELRITVGERLWYFGVQLCEQREQGSESSRQRARFLVFYPVLPRRWDKDTRTPICLSRPFPPFEGDTGVSHLYQTPRSDPVQAKQSLSQITRI